MSYNNMFPNNLITPNNQMPIQQPYGQQNIYQMQSAHQQTPNMPYIPQPIQSPYQASYRPSNQAIPDLSYNPQPMQQQYGQPSYRQPTPYNSSQSMQPMNQSQIFQKLEINPRMAQRLQALNSFKIVFIFDDSGSMNSVDSGTMPSVNNMMMTRWDELLQFARTSVELACLFSPNGCDIHFLNRPPLRNIRDSNQILNCFSMKPQGVTPLARTIQTVINENPPQMLAGKNLLLIIATDGEPTDFNGNVNIPEFKQCLYNRPNNVFITIVACTNDSNSIGYLNGLDRELPRLDVVDDYKSEYAEIKRAKGPHIPFSFGDYVAKSFLGSIDPDFDRSDE